MKKRILGLAVLLSFAMLSVEPVAASTQSYSFVFHSTQGTLPVNSGYKNDTEQNYYITISGGNVSSSNVFGTRIRKAADDSMVSSYVLHTSQKKSKAYAYSTSVNTSTLYYMKGKKDTSSTSSSDLNVSGKVTY